MQNAWYFLRTAKCKCYAFGASGELAAKAGSAGTGLLFCLVNTCFIRDKQAAATVNNSPDRSKIVRLSTFGPIKTRKRVCVSHASMSCVDVEVGGGV